MSKSTSIKEAIGRFEKEQNVVANEAQKVSRKDSVLLLSTLRRRKPTLYFQRR